VRVELVPARLVHVGPIASRMREIDRIEAEAMGRTPKDALRIGLRASLSAFTALGEGKPLAMMGVVSTSLISSRAAVWFLGRDEVFDHGREMLTIGPKVLGHWLETFEVLENIVAVQNVRATRMLRKWGFEIGDAVQAHGGVDFVPFRLRRRVGAQLAPSDDGRDEQHNEANPEEALVREPIALSDQA